MTRSGPEQQRSIDSDTDTAERKVPVSVGGMAGSPDRSQTAASLGRGQDFVSVPFPKDEESTVAVDPEIVAAVRAEICEPTQPALEETVDTVAAAVRQEIKTAGEEGEVFLNIQRTGLGTRLAVVGLLIAAMAPWQRITLSADDFPNPGDALKPVPTGSLQGESDSKKGASPTPRVRLLSTGTLPNGTFLERYSDGSEIRTWEDGTREHCPPPKMRLGGLEEEPICLIRH